MIRGASSRAISVGAALLLSLSSAACTAVATRSYDLPIEQVDVAAREAVVRAGYPGTGLNAQRTLLFGFFIGDGGEQIRVELVPAGSRTDVKITSEKQFAGFLAQQHYANEIAAYLDQYIQENKPLWERAVSTPVAQP